MARTDKDIWDLASSVGATATMVAAARAIASNDDVTALSAAGSRLAAGAPPATSHADVQQDQRMRKASAKWRRHGFDLELDNLRYNDKRHDYATYHDTLGWQADATSMNRLLADHNLSPFAEHPIEAPGANLFTSTLRPIEATSD